MKPVAAPKNYRSLVGQGIFWNSSFQVIQTLVTFATMLVLVRIIPPAEYGRATAVAGILGMINALSCAAFMAQALQLPEGVEPDWRLHFSAGMWIQGGLSLLTHGLAGLCWFLPTYRPIAPLLHVGALGILIDWPAQLRTTMLRRTMNFRRLRIAHVVGTLAGVSTSLLVGLAGGGAWAIVLANNVVLAIPLTVEILFFANWHPGPGWWRWPDWKQYKPALAFGLQQSGSTGLRVSRLALEAALLPTLLGYSAMGLLNRAIALFNASVGRVMSVLVDTAYPLLPRFAADRNRFATYATALIQAVLLLSIGGAVFLGLEGQTLSRVLYSQRWEAADPLLWPGALTGLALVTFTAASSVILAMNRLRKVFLLNLLTAALGLPMLAIAAWGGGLQGYAWAVAAGQLVAAATALAVASKYLHPGWTKAALLVPITATAVATAGWWAVRLAFDLSSPPDRLALTASTYCLAAGLALRTLFPGYLANVLAQLPRGDRILHWLRLTRPDQAA